MAEEYVSKEEFDGLKSEMNKSFAQIVDLIKKKPETVEEVKKAEVVKAQEKAVEPNNAYLEPVHPDWLADAKSKLGEALDHCEVMYPKNGNPLYTVVIKNEFSNDSSEHLNFYKTDKRTIPVTNGFESVKEWNSRIAQNLRLNPAVK